jgi:hypothetical protein
VQNSARPAAKGDTTQRRDRTTRRG